jgi:hypothetical protein
MDKLAVSNAGPIIHLSEINRLDALDVFKIVFIPGEVKKEVKTKIDKKIPIKVKRLTEKRKNLAAWTALKYQISLGEAEAIILCKTEKIRWFLTDDLEARKTAQSQGIEPHGSIGILVRAYREKKLTKKQTIKSLEELGEKSTLFITTKLIKQAINSVNDYSKNK